MNQSHAFDIFMLVVIVTGATIVILQYPLQTTFPIGGDATRYIFDAKEVAALPTKIFTNSVYPLTTGLLSILSLFPLYWPTLFTWLITIAHAITALSLGWLLYKVSGIQASALAAMMWALATVSVTPFTESGTLAQLLSLAPLVLFLHFIGRQSNLPAFIALLLTFGLHPISGIVGVLTGILASTIQRRWSFLLINAILAIIITLYALTLFPAKSALVADIRSDDTFDILDLVHSPFGPFVILAPLGPFLFFAYRTKMYPSGRIIPVLCFSFIATLLTYNNLLGVGAYIQRLHPYFILAIIMNASIALPHLVSFIFRSQTSRLCFIIAFLTSISLLTWQDNERIFRFYEYPGNYARLSADEIEAILWLKENAPTNGIVVSTAQNRHSEWIPIISQKKWIKISDGSQLWNLDGEKLQETVRDNGYTHAMILKHRERAQEVFPGGSKIFRVVYENTGAVIYDMRI